MNAVQLRQALLELKLGGRMQHEKEDWRRIWVLEFVGLRPHIFSRKGDFWRAWDWIHNDSKWNEHSLESLEVITDSQLKTAPTCKGNPLKIMVMPYSLSWLPSISSNTIEAFHHVPTSSFSFLNCSFFLLPWQRGPRPCRHYPLSLHYHCHWQVLVWSCFYITRRCKRSFVSQWQPGMSLDGTLTSHCHRKWVSFNKSEIKQKVKLLTSSFGILLDSNLFQAGSFWWWLFHTSWPFPHFSQVDLLDFALQVIPRVEALTFPSPPKKTGGMPLKVVGMDGWDGWMDSHG